MEFDVNNVLFGGFSAVVLVIFLVQTLKEAFKTAPEYIPALTLGVSLVLLVGAVYLPDTLAKAIGAALMVAAAASTTVRYVKNGSQDETRPDTHEGNDVQGSGYGYGPESTTQVGNEGGPDRVRVVGR